MSELIELILLFIASYIIGSVPISYLVVKWRYGVDIRQHGSGQVGASNIFRTFSKPLGIMVGLFDVGKGVLMVWAAQLLGLSLNYQVIIGTAVIIGHNWPIFLHFNAGRGVATTIGIAFYLFFPWGLVVFVAGAIFTLVLGSSPLPVLVGMALLPLAAWLLNQPSAITFGLLAFLIIMLIRRLTAPRSARSASVRTRELIFNRFFFDRDIRDGKSWIKSPADQNLKTKRKG